MKRLAWVVAALVAWGTALGAEPPAPADPVEARAFEVKFRALGDAADLVGTILSPQGTIGLQPRLKTITVQDHASVLDRVPALLASFDLPPRNVEITLALFLGTDRREQEAGRDVPSEGISRDVRGVAETLADFTKWNAYESLGGRSVTGAEGSPVEVTLSEDYRARYTVEAVGAKQIKLKGFTLERRTRGADGTEAAQVVFRADIVVTPGKSVVVGAAQSPESRRALFLTLQARAR